LPVAFLGLSLHHTATTTMAFHHWTTAASSSWSRSSSESRFHSSHSASPRADEDQQLEQEERRIMDDEMTNPSSSLTTTTNISKRRMRAAAPAAEKSQEEDHYYYWRPRATTAAAIEDAEPYMYKPYPSLNDLPDNVDTTNHRWCDENNDNDKNNTPDHPNERRHHHGVMLEKTPSFSSEMRPSSLHSSAAAVRNMNPTPGNDFPLNVSRRTRSTCSTCDEQHGTSTSVPSSTNERPANTEQEEEQFYQQRIRTTSFDRLPLDIAVPHHRAPGPQHEDDDPLANLYLDDRKPSASPSKKKMAPENIPTTTTMIEVSPGTHVRLRGAAETWEAVQADFYTPCQCLVCGSSQAGNDTDVGSSNTKSSPTIFCIQDAAYVLCPVCKSVSPVETTDDSTKAAEGVGLGFTLESLADMQKEMAKNAVPLSPPAAPLSLSFSKTSSSS